MSRFDIRTRSGLISPIIQGAMGSYTDIDSLAFFARVTAAGGSLTVTEQNAVDALVVSLKANNIWTNMKAIYPMVGASAAACAQNLKSSSFTGTFSGGWTFASTGVTPNGTNAYMSTGFNPSTDASVNSGCMGYYSRTNNGAQNMSEMGSLSTNYFFMHVCISNQLVLVPNTPPIVGYIYVSNTNSSGFFQTYRTGASTTGGRRNATSYTASIAYAAPNLQVYIGARNETSGAAYFSNRQCALSYLGDSINDTQASNFYTAVQTFQTSLSRQV